MAAELSDPRIGTLLEGRYRLDQRLAAGGMGVVYKGELVAIGKPVAIKFLHDALAAVPDLVKRFQREALTMSRLAHPHLVSVVDSGISGGVPFLVMDFVSGRSLAEVLGEGPLPAPRAVALTRQILAGVRHAHAAGVVHRDLKPDNIILLGDVEGDFVKILDFGLAKVVQGSESATQLTNTGFALGTPGYMSPEQARGTESDERSDLYAVGVILYHMVTGRKPFVADSPLAVLRMHMDDAPPPPTSVAPRSCSPELERVILRAMEKQPSARFRTAADFAQALAATREAGDAPPVAEDTPPPRRRGRPLVTGGSIARAVAAVATCVAVAALWSHLSRRQQQKMRRHLNEAVKVAQGAFDRMRQPEPEPHGRGHATPAHATPPHATPAHPTPAHPTPAHPTPAHPTPAHPTPAQATPPPPKPAPAPAPAASKPAEPKPQPPATPAPIPPSPVVAPSGAAATPAAPTPAPAATPPPATADTKAADDDDDDDDDDATPEEVAPSDTPGARLEEEVAHAPPPPQPAPPPPSAAHAAARPAPKPRAPTVRDAARLLAAGHADDAIQELYAVRRRNPRSAATALLLGHAYFSKLWRTDGLREYDTAIKLSPALRWNHTLVRNAVSALDDPTYRLARAVIKTRIGKAALAEVRRAARNKKNPRVQKRAARLVQQLVHGKRRRRR